MSTPKKATKLQNESRARRVGRVRAKIAGTKERPRLVVQRSLRHMRAQLIDDAAGKTVVAVSTKDVDAKLKGVAAATAVGTALGEKAKSAGVTSAVFDRRHYQYHGRVKAMADAARETGLTF